MKKYWELEAAKRTSDICQQHEEPLNALTMVAALKQTSIEFSKNGVEIK